ncbi:MAG: transporter [Proteobacteria bacterium]|nr:transporter [Pseudomonadota bacterium]
MSPWRLNRSALGLASALFLAAATASAAEDGPAPASKSHSSSHPGDHAPIGVMGDHLHEKGEVMLSYRYMRMRMDGNRDGTNDLTIAEILDPAGENFPVTPTDMDMQMHMLGIMYAPTDRLTLMGMIPYIKFEMDHETRMGTRFTTESEGVGDVKLTALYGLFRDELHGVHLNAGVSVPSGSINERDETPMGRVRLPYPMQTGSGTWDLLPGLTYTGQADWLSWGAQALGTIRLGRNDLSYRLGHRYDLTAWGAVSPLSFASFGLRLHWEDFADISGDDDGLNPAMVPTADPNRRGGERLNGGVSMNLLAPESWPVVGGHRLAIESLWPLYQSLDGPQLEVDWNVIVGWQAAF